ncbi:hypothetical protein EJ074_02100 [Mesorhizobium sp. M3A.F.Ca.ET.080.04.2.1]|nr:hypothetical protein EJ074_02100 [Mesorhizobium sp. M3A.F.Ca.ET.080.04.2.1]RWF24737.1 MAG: hypothetical protein EOS64_06630 [Mesorhizobium sp.]
MPGRGWRRPEIRRRAVGPRQKRILPTAYCLLPTAYCLLPTAYHLGQLSHGVPVARGADPKTLVIGCRKKP